MMNAARSMWGWTVADSGPLGDRAHPAVGGAPVEPAAVVAEQDRPRRPFADGQVDRPGRPGHQRDDGRLVALADDAQGAVAPLEAEVLDVGRARLADPQAVQAQEHGQGGVGVVDPLGREQNAPSSARSRPRASLGWTLGRRTYWAGLEAIRPSMWAKR